MEQSFQDPLEQDLVERIDEFTFMQETKATQTDEDPAWMTGWLESQTLSIGSNGFLSYKPLPSAIHFQLKSDCDTGRVDWFKPTQAELLPGFAAQYRSLAALRLTGSAKFAGVYSFVPNTPLQSVAEYDPELDFKPMTRFRPSAKEVCEPGVRQSTTGGAAVTGNKILVVITNTKVWTYSLKFPDWTLPFVLIIEDSVYKQRVSNITSFTGLDWKSTVRIKFIILSCWFDYYPVKLSFGLEDLGRLGMCSVLCAQLPAGSYGFGNLASCIDYPIERYNPFGLFSFVPAIYLMETFEFRQK
jgi:hypothetical protein